MGILSWIVVGLIAGWLAGMVMKGGGYGLIGDIIVGVIGGLLGGWIATTFLTHRRDVGDQPGIDPGRVRRGGAVTFHTAPAGWEKSIPTLACHVFPLKRSCEGCCSLA